MIPSPVREPCWTLPIAVSVSSDCLHLYVVAMVAKGHTNEISFVFITKQQSYKYKMVISVFPAGWDSCVRTFVPFH